VSGNEQQQQQQQQQQQPHHAQLSPKAEASIELHGDKSYYFWQKNLTSTVPMVAPKLVSVTKKDDGVDGSNGASAVVVEAIGTYTWADDGAFVKMYVDSEGVGQLSKDDVACVFDADRVELRVRRSPERVQRLFVVGLKHPIDPTASSFLVKRNKVIVKLAKVDKDKFWIELFAK